MKILLISPKFPDTFWSSKYGLKFIFKKCTTPPLGLLTVAAMLPGDWAKKLVDMNVTALKDKDMNWADYVFISAISIQKKSVIEIINRCRDLGVKTVAGGPLFTTGYDEFENIDHFVLNEAEITLPLFLKDLQNGCADGLYSSNEWADVTRTPMPRWDLINMGKYATMTIQYSRGCPFNCDFCDITLLYGHRTRTKDKYQILAELEGLYVRRWRNPVFFVDDNFCSNKSKLKKEILPAIIEWMKLKKYPFSFITQTSIDIADDTELMHLMAEAGFITVFLGIETPNEESLTECNKLMNKKRDLLSCVKRIQNCGLQVQSGFIVGFDKDPPSIFDTQIKFIQESGIVIAMVSLLNALRGTGLYNRLKKENRLLDNDFSDNTDCSLNFIPKIKHETLIEGYKKIIATIYSPRYYYARIRNFLNEYKPLRRKLIGFKYIYIITFLRSVFFLGIIGKERFYYWKLISWSVFIRPQFFPLATSLAIYGFHFRKTFEKHMAM